MKKRWNVESDSVEKFVAKYRADVKFAAEVNKDVEKVANKLGEETSQNSAVKAYVAARAATGYITGLGPAAIVGDVTRGVENGRTIVESVIAGGLLGETR